MVVFKCHEYATNLIGEHKFKEAEEFHSTMLRLIFAYPNYFNLYTELITGFITGMQYSGDPDKIIGFDEIKKSRVEYIARAKTMARDEMQENILVAIGDAITTKLLARILNSPPKEG